MDALIEESEKEKSGSKYLMPVILGITFVLAAALVLVITIATGGLDSNGLTQTDATESITDVSITATNLVDAGEYMKNTSIDLNSTDLYKAYNFSTEELEQLHESFSVFDVNNDDLWTSDEFEQYMINGIETSGGYYNDSVFNKMDIDNDNIVSFREMVYIMKLLNDTTESTLVINYLNQVLIPSAIDKYSLADVLVCGLWGQDVNFNIFEYVAALIMSPYDKNSKGYVKYEDYLSVLVNETFMVGDLDSDGFVTFDEFVNASFPIIHLLSTQVLNGGYNVTIDTFVSWGLNNLDTSEGYLDGNYLYNNNKIYQCPNMNLYNESQFLEKYYMVENCSYSATNEGLYSRKSDHDFSFWQYVSSTQPWFTPPDILDDFIGGKRRGWSWSGPLDQVSVQYIY